MKDKNKILYIFCALFPLHGEKGGKTSESKFVSVSEF